jgi:hypothetical protein
MGIEIAVRTLADTIGNMEIERERVFEGAHGMKRSDGQNGVSHMTYS